MPKELGIEVTMTASGKSRTAHAAAAMAALLVCDLTSGAGNLAGSRLSGGASRRTIDRICRTGCVMLEVQETRVQLIDQWLTRNLNLGPYIAAAQHLVPPTEAPISDLQTPEGWRVVTSVYLDHKEKNASTHIRFFHPDGRLRSTETALESVEQTEIGALFGGTGEIFAITTAEEHAYNDRTEIWLLPSRGKPSLLLAVPGTLQDFANGSGRKFPGVNIAQQTYDGVHANTKGVVNNFYSWDAAHKTLRLR
jgi:hypothetical protein